jgi:hypothetical protein
VLYDIEKIPNDEHKLEGLQSDKDGYEKMIRSIESGELFDDVAKE